MKNVILFVAAFETAKEIPHAKQEVKTFLGNRMIEEDCKGEPILALNTILKQEDLRAIDKILQNYKNVAAMVTYIEDDDAWAEGFERIALVQPFLQNEQEEV